MAQKRAARRGCNTVSGSKDSVELGRNGEYRPAKKPSREGVEGSQSVHARKGRESTDEETAIQALAAMAAARDGPPRTTKPPKPATAEPASSSEDDAGDMSSRRQEGMAKKLSPSEEEEKEKGSEEESTDTPGPNPQLKRKMASGRVTRSQQQRGKEGMAKKLPPSEEEEEESEEESAEAPSPNPQLKRKRASGRVTRSQQQPGNEGMAKKLPPSEEEEDDDEEKSEEESAEAPSPNPQPKSKRASGRVTRSQQQRGKEGAQPSESKKKITPAPLQQEVSQSEMPKLKKITPAPLQQQGEERGEPSESERPKSKRIRRIWTPSDEVQILEELVEHRRKQGKLPAPDNNDFFDSMAKRLEDKTCNLVHIKDKVRSLMRRYKSYVVPTTDHEKRLHDLSNRVWGDLPATHTANGKNGDGDQDAGEHAMEAENGGGQTLDKNFEEMCEMYPLLGQELKRLEGVQPALRRSFTGLDGKKALLMEQKLGKLKWKELKVQAEMEAKVEAPKARIRNQLVNFLLEVSKNL